MSSTTAADAVSGALAALDAATQAVGALDFGALTVRDQLEALDRLETVRRRAIACAGDWTLAVERRGEPALGGVAHRVIADVIRISPAEARRRTREASLVCSRTTLTGQQMPAALPATAKAWHAGLLDVAHLRTIANFFRDLPEGIHPTEVEKAEAFLAEKATELRTDQLQKVADTLAVTLNPDGRFSDDYRSTQRGFSWCGRQRPDGMSIGKVVATPELRAAMDAVLAKFAAPGMCNPADQTPTVAGEPSPERAEADTRTPAQRQHDALGAMLRSVLGDPKLGQHRGLPVTIIATATVEQLSSGVGHAVTGGGIRIPMRDLIRMASHAYHYLCVFESHSERPIYLGRTKRIASADQRIVLHAKDRGCTAPGCDVPGYLAEVHHVEEWAVGGGTDIDKLTFACGPHHRLLTPGGWKTRKRKDGRTEWLPPPHLPIRPGTNDFHHPERLFGDDGA